MLLASESHQLDSLNTIALLCALGQGRGGDGRKEERWKQKDYTLLCGGNEIQQKNTRENESIDSRQVERAPVLPESWGWEAKGSFTLLQGRM